MTDIEQKALALVNEVRSERGYAPIDHLYRTSFESEALCRAIERHEAFRQEVSDEVSALCLGLVPARLKHLIIPKPKPKPDPLVEVIAGWTGGTVLLASDLRAALEARGLEIREKNDER